MRAPRSCAILFGLALCLLSASTIQAQTLVCGIVKNSVSHEAVPGALVMLVNATEGKRLAYQASDPNGGFALEVNPEETTKIQIVVKALGFKEYKREIVLETEKIDIEVLLEEGASILNEIVVEQSRISQQGDTISYLADLFKKVDDRTLSDLLERLPGLSVSSTGQISYQGEPISKFYIDGLDLLQGKYGIATQNINVDQVASVQVLENHQPLRILKDIEVPTSAAINIRLKESKLGAFFGKAKLGAGFPIKNLFSNELSVMRFAQRMQNVLVLKQDDSGRDIASELTDQYLDWTAKVPQFLFLTRSNAPIDNRYTLYNNLYFGSLNSLYLLDPISTLTVNVDYKYDRLTHDERRDRQVFQNNGAAFNLIENSWSRKKENTFSAKVSYERNGTKKYIQNRTTIQKKENHWHGGVSVGEDAATTLLLDAPSIEISNIFSLINNADAGGFSLKWNSSYLITLNDLEVDPISSFLSHSFNTHQTLENRRDAKQKLNYSRFSTLLRISKTFRYGKNGTADLYSQVDYYRDVFDSQLLFRKNVVKDGINDVVYRTLPVQVGTTIRYNTYDWFLDLNLPLIYHYSRSDGEEFQKFRFLPELMANYRPSLNWDLSAYAAHRDIVPSYKNEITGLLLLNNNMLVKGGIAPPKQNTLELGSRVQYKNIPQAFFVNLWVNSSTNWVSSLANTIFEDNAFRYEIVPYSHRTHSWNIGVGVDWYLRSISTKFSLKPQFSSFNSKALYSGTPIDTQDKVSSIQLSADLVPFDWLRVRYNGRFSYSLHQLEEMKKSTRYNQSHECSLTLFPFKGFELQSKLTYYAWSQIQEQPSNALFGDLSVSYAINKHIELKGNWNNIFNAEQLLITNPIGSDLLTTTFYLRQSEVLFQCIISF